MKKGKTIFVSAELHAELKRRLLIEKSRRKYNVTYAMIIFDLLNKK